MTEGEEHHHPLCLVAYSFSLEQASASRGLARVHLLSCRSHTCPPSLPSSSHQNPSTLKLSAQGPPGLHRQVGLSLTLPSSIVEPKHQQRREGRLLLLYHLPEGAYVDVNELEQRHDFGLQGKEGGGEKEDE